MGPGFRQDDIECVARFNFQTCHCERSEAIHPSVYAGRWVASSLSLLAMTMFGICAKIRTLAARSARAVLVVSPALDTASYCWRTPWFGASPIRLASEIDQRAQLRGHRAVLWPQDLAGAG